MAAQGKRTAAIGLMLAVTFALVLPPADAGSGPVDVSLFSDRGRKWVGQGVVGSADDQTVNRMMKPGADAYATVRLSNTSERNRTFRVTGSPSNDYFDVTYTNDDVDVTASVTGDGYEVPIGKRDEYIYAEVEASEDAPTGESVDLDIRAVDDASGASDEVRAHFEIAPLRLWAVTRDGRLRCEATFDDRVLTPGYETGVRLEVTNLTDKRIERAPFEGSLVIRDEEGNELWDSSFDGGFFWNELAPHETNSLFVMDARVRWSGPLRVRPHCGDLPLRMPAATLEVSSPGSPASEEDSIHMAASRPGSPFADCEPENTETPAYTTLTPPDGRDEPAMPVRCSAEVRHEDGFDVVSLNMVYPDDESDFVIPERSGPGAFYSYELPGEGNFYAGRWSFVVTEERARPYISLSASRGVGKGRAYDYGLENGEWSVGGWSSCGFEGYSIYFNGTGFHLDWVASCDESSSDARRASPKRTVTDEKATVRR